MIHNPKAFLGKGWGFPFVTTDENNNLRGSEATYEESIRQSIQIILGTRPGERVMNPNFGSYLWDITFEPNNQNIYTNIRHKVHESLTAWEPRIIVDSIDINIDPDKTEVVHIHIKYTVNRTNTVHNLVYPFYIGRA